MNRLLCLDPGGAGGDTGVVRLDFDETTAAHVAGSFVIHGGYEGFVNEFGLFAGIHADHVVCEQFVNRNIAGADLTPLLIEGVVRFMFRDVVLQPASGKNTAVTDEAMKRAGFDKSLFKGDHHQDRWEALRHGLWYLKRHKHLPTLNAMYPR